MALIVEDGTIVAGANTYVTDAEVTAYADLRGIAYPATAILREPLVIKAMDYLSSCDFLGRRTDPDAQLLDFPRYLIYVNDRTIASDEIPREIKSAQIEAALAYNTQELLINEELQNVQSEELAGAFKTSYFKNGSATKPRLGRVNHLLEPFLADSSKLVRT